MVSSANSTYANTNMSTNGGNMHVSKHGKEFAVESIPAILYLSLSLWITVAQLVEYFRSKASGKISSKHIKVLTIICAFSSACTFAVDIFEELAVDYVVHDICSAIKLIKVIMGSTALSFSYLVFWRRQRSLYQEPRLSHLTNPVLRALSWISLCLCLFFPAANWSIYAGAYSFGVKTSGCTVLRSTIAPRTPWIISAVGSILIHSLLLWPFIRPIMKHASSRQAVDVDFNSIIKRSLACASVCAISDITAFTLCAIFIGTRGDVVGAAIQLTIVINMTATVVAFPGWQRTMFPMGCATEKQDENAVETTSRNSVEQATASKDTDL